MDVGQTIRTRFAESAELKRALLGDGYVETVARMVEVLAGCMTGGGRVLLCGNGGSAADATHLAAELVGRFTLEREPLAAISLSDNTSAMTCIANDYAFDEVFARQVRAHGREGDVLIAMTTSGRSPNVLRAVEAARELGMASLGLTGASGAELAAAADVCLLVPSDATPRIQEGHMLVGHTLCELVEARLFGPPV